MKTLLMIAVILIAGCGPIQQPLSNEEIVKQTEYCTNRGHTTKYFTRPLDGAITQIQCGGLMKED